MRWSCNEGGGMLTKNIRWKKRIKIRGKWRSAVKFSFLVFPLGYCILLAYTAIWLGHDQLVEGEKLSNYLKKKIKLRRFPQILWEGPCMPLNGEGREVVLLRSDLHVGQSVSFWLIVRTMSSCVVVFTNWGYSKMSWEYCMGWSIRSISKWAMLLVWSRG